MRMRRRDLILGLGGAVVVRVAAAQDGRLRRVGILAPAPLRPIESFKDRLRQHGWADGGTIRFEERWAQGDEARYAALATELAALPVDLIMTWSTPAVLAAKRASTTIPIVMAAIADPVGVGAVSSLARPGGNVTGFSTQNYELEAKRLELLREVVPGMTRVALLANASNPYAVTALQQAEFMAANRLPAVYPFVEFAEAGGLIAYSTNFDDLFRQAADYVDRILRGASPGELPVQQASTFKLIVNLNAARAIGLTIPRSVLIRADEVIE